MVLHSYQQHSYLTNQSPIKMSTDVGITQTAALRLAQDYIGQQWLQLTPDDIKLTVVR